MDSYKIFTKGKKVMKWRLMYILCDLEFLRLIFREVLLFIIGIRSRDNAINNVKWLQQGGYECEVFLEKYKDIPCEVAYSYLNHAHECIYR